MNFFIKFVPYCDSNKEIWCLPIQAKDKAEAEQFAFQLAITLDAEKSNSYAAYNGMTVYEKFENVNMRSESAYFAFYIDWS